MRGKRSQMSTTKALLNKNEPKARASIHTQGILRVIPVDSVRE